MYNYTWWNQLGPHSRLCQLKILFFVLYLFYTCASVQRSWWGYTEYSLSVRLSLRLQAALFPEHTFSLLRNFNFKFHVHAVRWYAYRGSKVHGANMGPTWVLVVPRWAPCWPHEPCYMGIAHGLNGILVYPQHRPSIGLYFPEASWCVAFEYQIFKNAISTEPSPMPFHWFEKNSSRNFPLWFACYMDIRNTILQIGNVLSIFTSFGIHRLDINITLNATNKGRNDLPIL